MNKYFLGLLYGYKFFIEAETQEVATIISKRFNELYSTPKRTFIQRLKYLFTNK